MMSKSVIQSERQRPRAIELMKDIYASEYTRHLTDPSRCGLLPEECPMMANLKKDIEEQEKLLNQGNSSRSFGLK
jgi:hypothetical protein